MREGYTLLEINIHWVQIGRISQYKFNLNKLELKRKEILLSPNVVLDPSLYNSPRQEQRQKDY